MAPELVNFLYPHPPAQDYSSASQCLFARNLQEFGQKVSYIVALHSAGKLSSEESFQHLKSLWAQLSASCQSLADP